VGDSNGKPDVTIIGTVGAKQRQVHLHGNGLQEFFGARARGGKNLPGKIKPVRFE